MVEPMSFHRAPAAIAVALALGCGSRTLDSGSAADAASESDAEAGTPPDSASCFSSAVPDSFRACVADGDCVVVEHATNCCNPTVYTGIAISARSAFLVCEGPWRASLPACGCDAAPMTEAGESVMDPTKVIVRCVALGGPTKVCRARLAP
jgi:hypothetical protein